MTSIYKTYITTEQQQVLEELRSLLANIAGVTLQGNRLTVRWDQDGALVDVHMIIESVTTPTEAKEIMQRREDTRELFKKYPDLEAELYFNDHGEWPQ